MEYIPNQLEMRDGKLKVSDKPEMIGCVTRGHIDSAGDSKEFKAREIIPSHTSEELTEHIRQNFNPHPEGELGRSSNYSLEQKEDPSSEAPEKRYWELSGSSDLPTNTVLRELSKKLTGLQELSRYHSYDPVPEGSVGRCDLSDKSIIYALLEVSEYTREHVDSVTDRFVKRVIQEPIGRNERYSAKSIPWEDEHHLMFISRIRPEEAEAQKKHVQLLADYLNTSLKSGEVRRIDVRDESIIYAVVDSPQDYGPEVLEQFQESLPEGYSIYREDPGDQPYTFVITRQPIDDADLHEENMQAIKDRLYACIQCF